MARSVKGRKSWDGARLKEIREARGLSQADVAKAAEVGGTEISRHERNAASSNPTVDVLARIAAALRVPLPVLFEPVGSPIPRPEEFGREHAVSNEGGDARIEDRLGDLLAYIKTIDGKPRGDFIRAVVALLAALEHARPAAAGGSAQDDGG